MLPQPIDGRRPSAPRSAWWRIAVMGVMLALLLFVAVFDGFGGTETTSNERVVLRPALPAAELYTPDPAILALAKDSTRRERLLREPQPFEHLLEKALNVVPDIAAALGMPTEQVPIARLRADPSRHRGRYLWYKGVLEALSPGKSRHPVPRYQVHEGRLRTDSGEQVLFAFSVPPPEDLVVGKDWVRIEGFFLKLRDDHFPPIDQAPILVGAELTRSLPDWRAVEELDPAVLARIHDGNVGGTIVDEQDMATPLVEAQDVPLWHLASYAAHQRATLPPAEFDRFPALTTEAQWRELESGSSPKGSRYRLMGTFQLGRTFAAKTNPLGIESWSEVWIQCRDLGGRTLPIWLPIALGDEWRRNQTVIAHGYFFKRYLYVSQNGERHFAPLFVAASLEPFSISLGLFDNAIARLFAGLVAIVTLGFLLWARRDRRQHREHETQLIERRRRRRSNTTPAGQSA
jgi:hypothetical protein